MDQGRIRRGCGGRATADTTGHSRNGPGITNHIWSIGELIETAIMGATPEPEGRRVGPFRVIDGGQN